MTVSVTTGGPPASTATRVAEFERNREIVMARLRGLSERHVAATFDVTERHVRRILEEYRESRLALHELDPAEALQDTLDAYAALIDEAVAQADQAQQESTRVATLKLRPVLLDARIRLVPGLGLVPTKLERARLVEEFEHAVRQVVRVLDRHGVSEHVQQEIVDTVEGWLAQDELPAAATETASAATTAA